MSLERIHKLVQHDTKPPAPVIELLKKTLIGTEGTLYQLLDTEQKIHSLSEPHFISIERNGKAIGNVTICKRDILLNGKTAHSLYIRYFAFDTLFQGGSKKGNSNSNFHAYFKALFETTNMNPVQPQFGKTLYWAFIDPQNLRSFNMNKRFGFETIGTFTTKAFSRITPKLNGVERLASKDQPEVLSAIQEFYRDYQFFSTVHLFENENYFVLKDKGEIICGIQANPVHWRIKSLPGFTGKLMLKCAAYIPGIRKLINPNSYRFLATEGLFWKPGHEDKVASFLEGVLAASRHHSLLIWTDNHNKRLEGLAIRWGLIQKIKKDNPIHIVARFNDYSSKEIDTIRDAPKYLSGFDMT